MMSFSLFSQITFTRSSPTNSPITCHLPRHITRVGIQIYYKSSVGQQFSSEYSNPRQGPSNHFLI